MQRAVHYLSVTFLLLVYAWTRLHNLLALPLFVDESFHIETAQRALKGQVLASAAHGRFGRVWLNAFLGPDAPAAGWTSRAGTVLVGLLGAAAFYALVRVFVSHRAGLLALLVWTGAPYLLFYDRMALADPMLSALSVVAVWVAWHMMQKGARWLAALLGCVLAALILAKAPGVVWLPLPVVALLLAADLAWRRRVELAALAYGTLALWWGPLALVLKLKHYNYFGLAPAFVGKTGESRIERIWNNMNDAWRWDVAYLSLPVLILAILGGLYWLWKRPRSAIFTLMALGMGAGGAIVFGRNVNSRYALNHVAWVLLALVVGIGLVFERYPRTRPVILAALTAWLILFCAPFMLDAWNDPPDLPLAGNDPREYVLQESSGYGTTEIGALLSVIDPPLPTLGLVANCQTLRVAAYPLDVTCPKINWDGTSQRAIMRQAEQWAADGPIYVVGESLPYIDLSELPQPHTLITTVERPGGNLPVHLFRIEQGAQRP
jgi:hypothetical protein